jgi:hypothetical protein
MMRVSRFVGAAFRMFSGPLIWAAHFTAIYAFTALACARHFAHASWLGVDVVLWAIGIGTSAAAIAALVVFLAGVSDGRRDDPFVAWMSAALGALALVAIVWEALPVLLVPVCG